MIYWVKIDGKAIAGYDTMGEAMRKCDELERKYPLAKVVIGTINTEEQ